MHILKDASIQNMWRCYIHILSSVSVMYCAKVVWIEHKYSNTAVQTCSTCSNCFNTAVRTHTEVQTVRIGHIFGFLIFWRCKQRFIIIWLYHHKLDTENILVPAAPIPVSPSNRPLFQETSPLEVSSHCWPTVLPEVVLYHFQQAQKGHLSLLGSKWSVETMGSCLGPGTISSDGLPNPLNLHSLPRQFSFTPCGRPQSDRSRIGINILWPDPFKLRVNPLTRRTMVIKGLKMLLITPWIFCEFSGFQMLFFFNWISYSTMGP